MPDIEKFKSELLGMPLAARELLAKELFQSISSEHEKLAADEEMEHLKIVKERVAEYEAGNIQMIPAKLVLNRLRQQ